jgi:hypothetical protein
MEEIIIFVDGNQFRVELQVGELGKYIREANTNFP